MGYFSTSYISNHDNHCGPIAVLNCIIYFAENGYPNLVPEVSGRYFYVFEEICKLMNFKDNGATPAQQVNALYSYINSIYPGEFKKHTDYYITHSDVTKRVNENVPFIFSVSGHSMYEDHSLVGLGYHKFECTYKGFLGITYSETNMFLRVADGWSGITSERYINYADANTRSIVWVTHS